MLRMTVELKIVYITILPQERKKLSWTILTVVSSCTVVSYYVLKSHIILPFNSLLSPTSPLICVVNLWFIVSVNIYWFPDHTTCWRFVRSPLSWCCSVCFLVLFIPERGYYKRLRLHELYKRCQLCFFAHILTD